MALPEEDGYEELHLAFLEEDGQEGCMWFCQRRTSKEGPLCVAVHMISLAEIDGVSTAMKDAGGKRQGTPQNRQHSVLMMMF